MNLSTKLSLSAVTSILTSVAITASLLCLSILIQVTFYFPITQWLVCQLFISTRYLFNPLIQVSLTTSNLASSTPTGSVLKLKFSIFQLQTFMIGCKDHLDVFVVTFQICGRSLINNSLFLIESFALKV